MKTTTWTDRMIATLTEQAEYYWGRYCKAANEGAKKHHERAYNRRMAAVKYLTSRKETE
jgi:hypothetical protein